MRLLKIRAENFRNYTSLEFKPHPFLNIITGENAQGKTNLLEAIFFNFNTYSYRANSLKDIIKWQEKNTKVLAIIKEKEQQYKQSVAINQVGKKKVLIDGVENKKKIPGHSGVILFTPDDLNLIKNTPLLRRKFLDQEVGFFHPEYISYLQEYNRLLVHRNHLLKNIKINKKNSILETLVVWDEQLVNSGIKVLLTRLKILKKLVPLAVKWHRIITKNVENLEIRYLSSLKVPVPLDEKQLKIRFHQLIKEKRLEEIQRCQTMVGPHRDDLFFLINGKNAKFFGSQGQQKTIVLSLKLALVSLYTEQYHSEPILLLDDVLFELDQHRQKMLFSQIEKGMQTFITTNHFDHQLLFNANYDLYVVEKGKINISPVKYRV